MENIEIKKIKLQLVDTDDPVANKTKWQPVSLSGGASARELTITSDRIVVAEPMEFKISFAKFLGAIKLIAASCFILFLVLVFKGKHGFGLGFLVLGSLLLLLVRSRIDDEIFIVDLTSGDFGVGKDINRLSTFSKLGKLKDIHAIQLLESRHTHDTDSTEPSYYYCYELNFVLKNSKRINFMAHRDLDTIISSANQVAKVLEVPVWRANCSQ